mgnify:FL=1
MNAIATISLIQRGQVSERIPPTGEIHDRNQSSIIISCLLNYLKDDSSVVIIRSLGYTRDHAKQE